MTNVGSDRSQLAAMAQKAKALRANQLDAVAGSGYFNSQETLACEQAGITVTLPKPMTSGAKAEGCARVNYRGGSVLPGEGAGGAGR